ncbi:MAG: crotonase [Anaerolineales bacterium]|nr:crotonase [Anaerolineales bacterium]
MTESKILYQIEDRIARITLNEPDQRNALTYSMVTELIAALRQAEADDLVRVVLLAAAGKHFSAGGNLREFAAEIDQPAFYHWESGALWEELFSLIPQMTKPVVAAVQGYALAGGCALAALCDLAVAADEAQFGMTEIRIGLFPLVVLPAIRRAVGDKKALELSLTGAMFDAQEALRIGIVNRVVPGAELDTAALALARDLAEKSREALHLGKRLFWDTAGMTYAQALSFGRSLRVNYMLSEDLREGTTAFLEKRKPNW